MKILDPQAAVLTNIEVLAYLSANPPRRSPPNSRNWVPSPDLRDHNTVVKEIHNYVTRISPHLLKYPRHTPRPSSSHSHSQAAMTGTMRPDTNTDAHTTTPPRPAPSEQTPMDKALRELIIRLQPYGLTKAEVVMILNLGVGLSAGSAENPDEQEMANGDGEMEVDQEAAAVNGENGEVEGGGEENGEGEEEGEDDTGALALFNTIVEELDSRIAEDQIPGILAIIREVLSQDYGS